MISSFQPSWDSWWVRWPILFSFFSYQSSFMVFFCKSFDVECRTSSHIAWTVTTVTPLFVPYTNKNVLVPFLHHGRAAKSKFWINEYCPTRSNISSQTAEKWKQLPCAVPGSGDWFAHGLPPLVDCGNWECHSGPAPRIILQNNLCLVPDDSTAAAFGRQQLFTRVPCGGRCIYKEMVYKSPKAATGQKIFSCQKTSFFSRL